MTQAPPPDLARAVAAMAGARPLDRAAFAFACQGGPASAVADALAAFQNDDGGFGRFLEPDFRLAASSALATSIALQHLRAIGAPADHPLVAGALRFLAATCDPVRHDWEPVPAAINDVPRAFWWEHGPPEAPFRGNPGAELLGALYRHGAPADLVARVAGAALPYFEGVAELEWHELLSFTRLFEDAPPAVQDRLRPKLRDLIRATVPLDPAAWTGYTPRPRQFAATPAAPFADVVAAGLDADLARLLEERGEDGAWHPSWAWGRHEADWPAARAEWVGVLTNLNLQALVAHGKATL